MGYVIKWRDEAGNVYTQAYAFETRAEADDYRIQFAARPGIRSAWVDEVPDGQP